MNSKTIVLFFCAIYALVFLCGLAELFRARKANCKNEVRLPVLYFWIGTVVSAVFLVIAWLSAVQENSIALTLGFGVLVLLGISLMLAWRNCHITFDRTGFTRKNLLGFRRNFTYGELTAWRRNNTNPMESFLYVGKKKISFNILHHNGPAFIKAVRHGYRSVHSGNALPDMGNILRAGTGFRAHVHNPGEFLFIFIMLVVFFAGAGILCTVYLARPITAEDGDSYELTFSAWEVAQEQLILTSPQMPETFVIDEYETYLSHFDSLQKSCNGTTVFSVCAKWINPDKGPSYYRVLALSSPREAYWTFEDSTAVNREGIPSLIALFGTFLLVILALSALTYVVGCNPQKFPKWLVHSLFKKGAIDI